VSISWLAVSFGLIHLDVGEDFHRQLQTTEFHGAVMLLW